MIGRKAVKLIIERTLRPVVKAYLNKEREYRYENINVTVFKGVFHPGFFFSTKILLDYLTQFDLSNKTLLELGAGTGLISVYAAKKNAKVTASDISKLSLENVKKNVEQNKVNVQVIHSDLFDNISSQKFDFIIINPPYYKKEPKSEADYAWYCGEYLEYFKKLFKDLPSYINQQSKVIIVLSEDCNLEEIKLLAAQNNLQLILKKNYLRFWEMNYVFEIVPLSIVSILMPRLP